MSTCTSFTCPSRCSGYWYGCRAYSCVDMPAVTPSAQRITISDTDGICTHIVTKINDYSGAWSDGGSALRNYQEASHPANIYQTVYNEHIIDLRDAINEERLRRRNSGFVSYSGLNKETWSISVVSENLPAAISELSSSINEIQSGAVSVYPVVGQYIDSTHIDRVRKAIESLRKSCICDTDCGSNTVCSCYCNCGCNYSDVRLKRNIRNI